MYYPIKTIDFIKFLFEKAFLIKNQSIDLHRI